MKVLRRTTVRVPGSTANLGPGFDALALAINLYCTLSFDLLDCDDSSVPLITFSGSSSSSLPKDETNLVYRILKDYWQGDPELFKRYRITINTQIPPGKGLGSSAAAIIGALWAADTLSGVIPDRDTLLTRAVALEGHADNLSASLSGGLAVCATGTQGSGINTEKLKWLENWCPIIIVPPYELSTQMSRAALPRAVPLADAVANVQRVSLLLAAVFRKDEKALRQALHDRLHEPYRLTLVPQLSEIRKLLADLSLLGCVLSGAGPSVLVLVERRHRGQVTNVLQNWAASQAISPEVFSLEVDQEGLSISYE